MTFSIVANDRDAGYCGSAVASRSIVRLFEALRAGDRAGGDRRGRQAAAIGVTPHRDSRSTAVSIDLRVDDHVSPIEELGRLHDLLRREFRE